MNAYHFSLIPMLHGRREKLTIHLDWDIVNTSCEGDFNPNTEPPPAIYEHVLLDYEPRLLPFDF